MTLTMHNAKQKLFVAFLELKRCSNTDTYIGYSNLDMTGKVWIS